VTETTTPHPNEELLRRYWKVTTEGDIDAMMELLGDDCVYHYSGQHPLSGDYYGKKEVHDLYTTLAGLAVRGGMFEGHVHELVFGAEFSVIILSYRLNLFKGRSIPGRACGMMRIIDGKVREYWLFEWDQSMINDVFWSSAPQLFLKKGDYRRLVLSLPRTALGMARTMGRLFGNYRAPTSV
jgi:ketosteroid isomerase-like protein